MKKNIADISDIKIFVDEFYNKVRNDGLIGPVFSDKIIGDWQPHLNKMYAFWNASLFGVAGFRGNPFARHAPLKIEKQHFDRWLLLFNETIDDHFEGDVAALAKQRAGQMANMFLLRLQQVNGNGNNVVV
ncbi:MAG: globin [Mucilaginibacter sp.]|nr:globin [Mucilaginibacter sp.]